MASTQSALRKMRRSVSHFRTHPKANTSASPSFASKRRIFASCGEKTGECRIVVQLESEHAARIVDTDRRFERYTRQKDCVSMNAAGVKSWNEIAASRAGSYLLNAPTAKSAAKTRSTTRKPRKKA